MSLWKRLFGKKESDSPKASDDKATKPPFPAASRNRRIRVFVSSTFRDMMEERDHLVKHVFPQLRNMCEQRDVSWGEVDLRWGIPDEDTDEVLPLCLEEIQRCRPYFIGILGERYGYVPQQVRRLLAERYPWLEQHRDKSLTELEILHGVLNDPEASSRAFFYFRDPGYLDRLPPDSSPRDFQCESPEARRRLDNLKTAIRDASRRQGPRQACRLRESYRDAAELGALVLADFTALIDELFPVQIVPDPLEKESARHEALARRRARVYVRRPDLFDRLETHVEGQGPPLVVSGDAGMGKSGLLADWFTYRREKHPAEFAVIHSIGSTQEGSDPYQILRRILLELKRRFHEGDEVPEQSETLRREFPRWIARVAARERIVLVLDGLDQLADRDAARELGWLPATFPAGCRVVVSSSPGPSLEAARRRKWPELAVPPMTGSERKELAIRFLARYSRRLSPARLERIASSGKAASPLFLCAVLDELRQFGEHERLDERIEYYLAAKDLESLYNRIFKRWEADYGAGTVRQSLALLWAARFGLSESEILDLLGKDSKPLPRLTWTPFYLAAESVLAQGAGLLALANPYVRNAIRAAYCPDGDSQRKNHLRLADYFEGRILQGKRVVEELPWQLSQAGEWRRLAKLLADVGFLIVTYVESGPTDVMRYWAQIESAGAASVVAAYQPVIKAPDGYDPSLIQVLASLLLRAHPEEAAGLYAFLIKLYRRTGDRRNLEGVLWAHAMLVRNRGDWPAALGFLQEHERLCRELGDESALAASLLLQAQIRRDRGERETAWRLLKEQEKICRKIDHRYLLAASLGAQGSLLFIQRDMEKALRLHQEQEELCRSLGDHGELNAALGNQAIIYQELGDLDHALSLYREEERVCREMGDSNGLASALGGQAMVLRDQGQYEAAMAVHAEEERLFRESGHLRGIAASLANQATIPIILCDFERAHTLLKESERISRDLGDSSMLAIIRGKQETVTRREAARAALSLVYQQARTLMEQGKDPISIIRELEGLCQKVGDKKFLWAVLMLHAQALGTQDRDMESLPLLVEAEKLSRDMCDKRSLAACLGLRASILQNNGQPGEALALHKEEERILREIGERRGVAIALLGQSFIEKSLGKRDRALAQLLEAADLCREVGDHQMRLRLLGNQIELLKELGREKEARALHQECEEIARKHGG